MKQIFAILFTVSFLTSSTTALAQADKRTQQFNLNKSRLAIDGYDPVSYFVSGKGVEGKKDLAYAYEGAVYRFVNLQNRQAFIANPAKYEPQYGGWCAYAMGDSGEKVEVDPDTFKILDGKLYLFYNRFFNNTLTSWNKNEKALKEKADSNWKTIFTHTKK